VLIQTDTIKIRDEIEVIRELRKEKRILFGNCWTTLKFTRYIFGRFVNFKSSIPYSLQTCILAGYVINPTPLQTLAFCSTTVYIILTKKHS
jgi:hypothetical protein